MSNPSVPPRRGGLTPPDASPTRPAAPGSAGGVDDTTAIRPAVRVDEDRPTLAQRIMQSRAQDATPDDNHRNGSTSNGSYSNNGANGSSPARAAHGVNASNGSAPTAARPQRAEQPELSRPSPGAPNTGQPFRNGTPRPPAQPPVTYSPVPGGGAAAGGTASGGPVAPLAPAPPVPSLSSHPASQPTAPAAAPQSGPPAAKPKKKADPFSAWRKPDDAAATKVAPVAGPTAARAATGAPAARQEAPPRQETLTTGAAGGLSTGQAAQGVPRPAAKASATSASSASSAKSDKLIVRRTRKARLRLSRVDPWSVMKTAFMFSIAAGIVLVVAVYSLWNVIQASDMFTAINQIVQDAIGTQGDTTPFQIETYINTSKVMGATALIAVVDVVVITALATLTCFLYNLSASVLGGLEVTLAED